jgi:hypothetical protein
MEDREKKWCGRRGVAGSIPNHRSGPWTTIMVELGGDRAVGRRRKSGGRGSVTTTVVGGWRSPRW